MKIHRWADIKNQKMTPQGIVRSAERVARDALSIRLQFVRQAAGLTQEQLGERATLSQSQLSRLERSGNAELATIARYVHAAGATLEVSAILNGKKLMLLSEKKGLRLPTKIERSTRKSA
jgi:transcriptional regulator with XRE-family HTH domain